MVAKRWTLEEANEHLREVLDHARTGGPQEVTDQSGTIYRIEKQPPVKKGGVQPGERFSEWVRRTLPPGDPIDGAFIRNPDGNQHRERWIWEMMEEDDSDEAQAHS